MPDNISKLYGALIQHGYSASELGGDENSFRNLMKDEKNRDDLYRYVSDTHKNDFVIGDRSSYDSRIAESFGGSQKIPMQRLDEPAPVMQPVKQEEPVQQAEEPAAEPEKPANGNVGVVDPKYAGYAGVVSQRYARGDVKSQEEKDEDAKYWEQERKKAEESGLVDAVHERTKQAKEEMAAMYPNLSQWEKNTEALSSANNASGASTIVSGAISSLVKRIGNWFSGDARAKQAEIDMLEDTEKKLQEATHAKDGFLSRQLGGVYRGAWDKGSSIRNWDFGLSDAINDVTIKKAIDKYENGEELTAAETALLNALSVTSAINAAWDDQISKGYSFGEGMAESAGYMAQFATGVAGVASKAAQRGVLLGVEKAASKGMAQYIARGQGRSALMRYMADSWGVGATRAFLNANRFVGDAIGAAAMTATVGMPQVIGEINERKQGEVLPIDMSSGKMEFGGVDRDTDRVRDAERAGVLSVFGNYWTEGFGDYFGVGGKALMRNPAARKILHKIPGFKKAEEVLALTPSGEITRTMNKLSERVKFNDVFSEIGEEMGNNVYDAAFVHDLNFSIDTDSEDWSHSIFNPETNFDLIGQVVTMNAHFYAVRKGANMFENRQVKAALSKASAGINDSFGAKAEEIRKNLNAMGSYRSAQYIKELAQNGTIQNNQQLHDVLNYSYLTTAVKGLNVRNAIMDGEGLTKTYDVAYQAGFGLSPDGYHQSAVELTNAEKLARAEMGEEGFAALKSAVEGADKASDIDSFLSNYSQNGGTEAGRIAAESYIAKWAREKGVKDWIETQAQTAADQLRTDIAPYVQTDRMTGAKTISMGTYTDPATGVPEQVYIMSQGNGLAVVIRDNGQEMVPESTVTDAVTYDADQYVGMYYQQTLQAQKDFHDYKAAHHAKTVEPAVGLDFTQLDDKGQPKTYRVYAQNEDGTFVVSQTVSNFNKQGQPVVSPVGENVTMTREELLDIQDKMYETDDVAANQEQTVQAQEAAAEQASQPSAESLAATFDDAEKEALSTYQDEINNPNNTEDDILAFIENEIASEYGQEAAAKILQYHESLKQQASQVNDQVETEEAVNEEPASPVAEEQATEQPVAEEPVAEQPVVEQPAAEPVNEEPVDPAKLEADIEKSGDVERMASEYVSAFGAVDDAYNAAVKKKADVDKKVESTSGLPQAAFIKSSKFWGNVVDNLKSQMEPEAAVTEETPAVEQSVAEEPVAEQPVTETPAAEPVAEQPVVEQPAAEPVAEEPVAEPVAETPAPEKPKRSRKKKEKKAEEGATEVKMEDNVQRDHIQPDVVLQTEQLAVEQPTAEQPAATEVVPSVEENALQQQPLLDEPVDAATWIAAHPGQTPTSGDLFPNQSDEVLGEKKSEESVITDKGVKLTRTQYEGGYRITAESNGDRIWQSYYPDGTPMTSAKGNVAISGEGANRYIEKGEDGALYMKDSDMLKLFMENNEKAKQEAEAKRKAEEEKKAKQETEDKRNSTEESTYAPTDKPEDHVIISTCANDGGSSQVYGARDAFSGSFDERVYNDMAVRKGKKNLMREPGVTTMIIQSTLNGKPITRTFVLWSSKYSLFENGGRSGMSGMVFDRKLNRAELSVVTNMLSRLNDKSIYEGSNGREDVQNNYKYVAEQVWTAMQNANKPVEQTSNTPAVDEKAKQEAEDKRKAEEEANRKAAEEKAKQQAEAKRKATEKPTYAPTDKPENHVFMSSSADGQGEVMIYKGAEPDNGDVYFDSRMFAMFKKGGRLVNMQKEKAFRIEYANLAIKGKGRTTCTVFSWSTDYSLSRRGGMSSLIFDSKLNQSEINAVYNLLKYISDEKVWDKGRAAARENIKAAVDQLWNVMQNANKPVEQTSNTPAVDEKEKQELMRGELRIGKSYKVGENVFVPVTSSQAADGSGRTLYRGYMFSDSGLPLAVWRYNTDFTGEYESGNLSPVEELNSPLTDERKKEIKAQIIERYKSEPNLSNIGNKASTIRNELKKKGSDMPVALREYFETAASALDEAWTESNKEGRKILSDKISEVSDDRLKREQSFRSEKSRNLKDKVEEDKKTLAEKKAKLEEVKSKDKSKPSKEEALVNSLIEKIRSVVLSKKTESSVSKRISNFENAVQEGVQKDKLKGYLQRMSEYLENLYDEANDVLKNASNLDFVDSWNDLVEYVNLLEEYRDTLSTYADELDSENVDDTVENVINEVISPEETHPLAEAIRVANQFVEFGEEGIVEVNDKLDLEESDSEVLEEYPEQISSLERDITMIESSIAKHEEVLDAVQEELDKRGVEYTKVEKPVAEEPLNRTAEDSDTNVESKEKILERVNKISEKLRSEVYIIESPEQLPEERRKKVEEEHNAGRRIPGWYNPNTGQVVLYLPDVINADDAESTILHELVGHKGLRYLLGESFNRICEQVYKGMSDLELAGYIAKYGNNKMLIAEEYMSSIAESGVKEPSLWRTVVLAIKKGLSNLGFNVKLNEDDVKVLLWMSNNLLTGESKSDSAISSALNLIKSKLNSIFAANKGTNDKVGERTVRGEDDNDSFREGLLRSRYGVRGYVSAERTKTDSLRDIEVLKKEFEASGSESSGSLSGGENRSEEEKAKEILRKAERDSKNREHVEKLLSGSVKNETRTGESDVYVDSGNSVVYKVKDPFRKIALKGGNVKGVIYEHIAHNILFPNTKYSYEGLSLRSGEPALVLSQKMVTGAENASDAEVEKYLKNLGFHKINSYTYSNGVVSVTDVEGSNVLKDESGNLYFIDPIIRFEKDAIESLDELSELVDNSGAIDRTDDDPDGTDGPGGGAPLGPRAQAAVTRFMTSAKRNPSSTGPVSGSIKEQWDKVVNGFEFMLSEVYGDHLKAIEEFQKFLGEKSGKAVRALEDCYNSMLALSSKIFYETQSFDRIYTSKLNKALVSLFDTEIGLSRKGISEIIRRGKLKSSNWDFVTNPVLRAVNDYVQSKHGIERNRDMAVRKSLFDKAKEMFVKQNEYALKKVDEVLAAAEKAGDKAEVKRLTAMRKEMLRLPNKHGLKTEDEIREQLLSDWYRKVEPVRTNESLTWSEQQRQMDQLAIAEGADLTVDYSGLSSIYSTDENWHDAAYAFVEDYEKNHDEKKLKKLWSAIDGITKYSLRRQEEFGLAQRGYYDSQVRRFQYFVPLRGFAVTSAEDIYEYLHNDVRGAGDPVKGMVQRTSEAANSFASMMQVAYQTIDYGNDNAAKVKFYHLVKNHMVGTYDETNKAQKPTEEIAYVTESWLVNTAEEGKEPVWELRDVQLNERMSDEQVNEAVRDFEKEMKELRAQGRAKMQKELPSWVPYRVTNPAGLNEHTVKMKVNGRQVSVVIGANPRVAQAVNGLLKPSRNKGGAKSGWGGNLYDWAKNFKAGVLTSLSVNFSTGNLSRDSFFSNFVAESKFGSEFAKKFRKHQGYYFGALGKWGQMGKLLAMYQTGKLDSEEAINERFTDKKDLQRALWFKSFMENGGATGYTFVQSLSETRKKLETDLTSVSSKASSVKRWVTALFDLVELTTQASELVNRFAAYEAAKDLGWAERDCVKAAKEITLNFNRKGAGYSGMRSVEKGRNLLLREKGLLKEGEAKKLPKEEIEKLKQNVKDAEWYIWKIRAANLLAEFTGMGQKWEIFFNAGVQDKFLLWNIMRQAPKKFATYGIATPMMLSSIMYFVNQIGLPMLYAFVGGDDDDEDYYDLSDYDRTHNICFRIPKFGGHGGGWVKLPIPQGFTPFYTLGDVLTGQYTGKRDCSTVDFAQFACDVVMPLGINLENMNNNKGILREVFGSTAFSDVADVFANKDFVGRRVYYEPMRDEEYYGPAYNRAKKGTSPALMWAVKELDKLAGGTPSDPSFIGEWINPSIFDHLSGGLSGGYYNIPKDFTDIAWKAAHPEEANGYDTGSMIESLGLFKRLYLSGGIDAKGKRVRSQYYVKVNDLVKKVKYLDKELTKREKALEPGDSIGDAALRKERDDFEKSKDYRIYNKIRFDVDEIEKISDLQKKLGDTGVDPDKLELMRKCLDTVRHFEE